MGGMLMGSLLNIKYTDRALYKWKMPSQISAQTISLSDMDAICESCESLKDEEIKEIKTENKKLRKVISFLKQEMQSLELKTALDEKAIPFKEVVKEFTSTPKGKRAWEDAWKEQFDEWKKLADAGKISRIKYYRLINGMDQATLAKKLGTAQPNISRIEKPGYNIPIKTLEKLSRIFKVKKGDLIEE
jgi:DNA-binding XRE family transcriptional regulator